MFKVLIIMIATVGLLTVGALMLTDEDDDFLQAQEDEEQAKFLEEWRKKHGRR